MPETEERKYTYHPARLASAMAVIIQRHVTPDVWRWLEEKSIAIQKKENVQDFRIAFSATPRKTGKQRIVLSDEEEASIQQIRRGLTIQHWTIDRLSRVWFILHLDAGDQNQYQRAIEDLFPTAEMNEQVALYSALPVLAYPAAWRGRCAEGIRSNISDVLESIMCDNPYPSENLDEPAWNQLVLKAIFTEKAIHRIIGLEERANQNLANTLSDYAHERWAAHRTVHPMLWRCVGKFINEKIFPDIQRIALSENTSEREAAALACAQSTYDPARELLETNAELRSIIKSGITWNNLAEKTERVS